MLTWTASLPSPDYNVSCSWNYLLFGLIFIMDFRVFILLFNILELINHPFCSSDRRHYPRCHALVLGVFFFPYSEEGNVNFREKNEHQLRVILNSHVSIWEMTAKQAFSKEWAFPTKIMNVCHDFYVHVCPLVLVLMEH